MVKVELPLPVSRTVDGPVVTFKGSDVCVKYDCEVDDGRIRWAELLFCGVMSCHSWTDICCPVEVIGPFDSVVVLDASPELLKCRAAAGVRLGDACKDWPIKTFRIYFDHSAALEIVAEEMTATLVSG